MPPAPSTDTAPSVGEFASLSSSQPLRQSATSAALIIQIRIIYLASQ